MPYGMTWDEFKPDNYTGLGDLSVQPQRRVYPDQTRNLNPTPAAKVAMIIWGSEYAAQGGGSMDFWDKLSDERKRRCELVVTAIKEARCAK